MSREHYAFLTTEKNDVLVTAFLWLEAVYHGLARGLSLASGLSPIWLSETRNAPDESNRRIS